MFNLELLGIEPIINASGAVTRLGGAPMPEAALNAYCAAAGESIPLEQLQGIACRIIAEVTGAEAGLVTSGAAAGELPPRSNLHDLVATGADLVTFSGGKAIRQAAHQSPALE